MAPEPVYLGVPAVQWMWTQSARSLMLLDTPPGSKLDIADGTSLPGRSRNKIIKRYLDHDCPWLMLVDSDMVLPGDAFRRLSSWGEPAVWALAFQRCPDYKPIPKKDGQHLAAPVVEGEDGLVEARRAGAGCIVLRREVLEAVGRPWFEARNAGGSGEDHYFCDRVREEGYRVMVDYGCCARHVGATAVDADFAQAHWAMKAHEQAKREPQAAPAASSSGSP